MRRIGNAFFFWRSVAMASFLLPVGYAAGAKPKITAPVGVVVVAQGAQISQVTAVNGTSLYPGDTLSTDATGSLRIRFGTSQLMLGPSTAVKLQLDERAIAAILQHGVVRFSAAGTAFELQALGHVVVRSQSEAASGELAVVGASEFQISCTRGALAVEIDGVQRIVTESSSYDVTLKDALDEDNARHSGRSKKFGVWIPISAILITTGIGLYLATLSSSKF